MKYILLQVDNTQEKYLEEGISLYLKRLKNYSLFEVTTINVPKNIRLRTFNEQKVYEAKLINGFLQKEDYVVLLDENGEGLTSIGFSEFIRKRQNASTKRIVFVIGGPYGFDEVIYKRGDYKLSLSMMTFSHQMIRLFFVEQLYRAFTILKGEKYHHS
ncbi:MAG: 23S rRNA (pseudouridine(1915)-N(3))-methyltransferase RlmH [Bacteroidetes bacterium]|nr:23S rRNA (pseudouridine(1915)-N(3))-methyltransferase RlmH [Bacteroidota bacterium]MCA6444773.1 23S rRNA (pseudouridine(1915)-N(3))-methyltransferase RlmH [Bacteroidota bacterium]